MNKPIRTIAIFCLLLFVALMANATYLQYFRSEALNDRADNRRVFDAAFSRERGSIIVGRETIAESIAVDDQFEFQRTYKQPFKYAPLTGFFAYAYGASQLERTQNDVLSGNDDRLFVTRLVDLLSNQGTRGGNIRLTVNPAAQDAASAALAKVPGNVRGSVVALEPKTGKILAMVTSPTYDPNKLASHDLQAVDQTWKKLSGDDAEPMLNRGTQKSLPPGSTFKLVTAAAAIEDGLAESADDLVPGGTQYQLPQTTGDGGLIDNEGRSCGSDRIPFTQAMGNSCNTTFAQLAIQVGEEKMREQAEKFGFNQDYLEDLRPQAVSTYPEDSNEPQTGQAGIGQFEVRATPLQMAMVAAGIANNGDVMLPYVVDEVQSADLDVVETTQPEVFSSQAVSPATAKVLTDLMTYTVNDGTAGPAAIPGIQVAGKTGTAQSGQDDVPPYAWFVSFAPADDPEVAVAVMIESADIARGEIGGGIIGGPIAKAVMEAVIK